MNSLNVKYSEDKIDLRSDLRVGIIQEDKSIREKQDRRKVTTLKKLKELEHGMFEC